MAVSFVASSRSGAADSFGASNTCPVPTGAASGDIALLAMECFTGGGDPAKTPTWPTGFTQFVDARQGGVQLLIAWKRLSAADTGNYVTSWSGNIWNQSNCILIRGGVSSGTPVSTSDSNNTKTGSGTSITATSGSSVGEPFLTHYVAKETGSSTTPPSSFTETQEGDYVQCSYRIPASTGSHTATGATISVSGGWASALVIVEPDGSGSNTGTLAASMPRLTAALAGTQADAGTLSASLPRATASLTGQSTNPVALAAAVPTTTAALAGTSTNPATLAASAPAVMSSVAGSAVNPASLNASVPRLTGAVVDQAVNPGTLAGSLPVLTGSITGGSANPAALAASLPRLTSSASATATNTGTLAATLPALRGQVSDQTINTAALTASLPRVTALLPGQSINPATLAAATPTLTGGCAGAMANPATLLAAVPRIVAEIAGTTGSVDATPVQRPRLTLALPRSAAVLAIPRSAVALAIPTSRAEITPMDGYTRNDTGPDLTMTLTSTPAQTFTGAAAVVHVRKPGGRTLTKTPQSFDTGTGVVTVAWVAGDLDESGPYEAECQVTYSNNQIQTFGPASFVVRDELG